MPESTPPADPRLWLEEVEGADALGWVRERNARTLGTLAATPAFARTQASIQARPPLDSGRKKPPSPGVTKVLVTRSNSRVTSASEPPGERAMRQRR